MSALAPLHPDGTYMPPSLQAQHGALAKKLAEVMKAVSHVEKAGRNSFQNYNYQRATDMAAAVRNELSNRHIIMLPDIIESNSYTVPAKEGVMQAIDIKVRYTFVDGDSGATLSFVGMGTGTDKGDKAVYKAHTGALKYALKDFFMIPEEGDDPEADESTDKHVAQAKPVAKASTKPPAPKPEPINPVTNIAPEPTILELCKVDSIEKSRSGKDMFRMLINPVDGADLVFCYDVKLHDRMKQLVGTPIKVTGKWGSKGFFMDTLIDEPF